MNNILIAIPICDIPPFNVNHIECRETWVPLIRKMGYDVIFTGAKKNIESDYIIENDFFYSKGSDELESLFYKRIFEFGKWALNQRKYTHFFFIDSDSFVHPIRFHIEMIKLFKGENNIDYMGCAIPYLNWNPFDKIIQEIYQENLFAAGCGFLLSKKALKLVINNFEEKNYISITKGADDWIVGNILYKQSVNLLHNNSISCESKWKKILVDPSNIGTPDISDKDSHLFLQHYCNSHMNEIMDKLELTLFKNY